MFNPDYLFTLYKALHLVSIKDKTSGRFSAQIACQQLMKFINKKLSNPKDVKHLRERITALWENDNTIDVSSELLIDVFTMMGSNDINEVSQEIIGELVDRFQRISAEQQDLLGYPADIFDKIVELEKEALCSLEEKNHQDSLEKIIDMLAVMQLIIPDFTSVYAERLTVILKKICVRLHELVKLFIDAHNIFSARLAHEVFLLRAIALLELCQGKLTAEEHKMKPDQIMLVSLSALSAAIDFIKRGEWQNASNCCTTIAENFNVNSSLLTAEEIQRFSHALEQFNETFIVTLLGRCSLASQLITQGAVECSATHKNQALLMIFKFAEKWRIHLDSRANTALSQLKNACIDRYSQSTVDQNEINQFVVHFLSVTNQQKMLLDIPSTVHAKMMDLEKQAAAIEEKNNHEIFVMTNQVHSLFRIMTLEYFTTHQGEMTQFLDRSINRLQKIFDHYLQASERPSAIFAYQSILNFLSIKQFFGAKNIEDIEILKACHKLITVGFVRNASDLLKVGKLDEAYAFHKTAMDKFVFLSSDPAVLNDEEFAESLKKFKEIFVLRYVQIVESAISSLERKQVKAANSFLKIADLMMKEYAEKFRIQLLDAPCVITVLKKLVSVGTQEMQDVADEKAAEENISSNAARADEQGAPTLRSSSSACPSTAMFTAVMGQSSTNEEHQTVKRHKRALFN